MIVGWSSAAMTAELYLIDGDEVTKYSWEAGRTLAHDMLAYLRDRLAEHGANLDGIKGIIVYRGPGSYTGLRIGLTVLNTLAAAQALPIVGVGGEDWLAHGRQRLMAGESDEIVLPEYGGEAHVTVPRK